MTIFFQKAIVSMTLDLCLFLEAAFKVGDGALNLAAPFVLLRPLKQVFLGHFFENSKKTEKNSLKLSTWEARSHFCSFFLAFYHFIARKKPQNFGSKTQPIGGQVPPITSLRVPKKNPWFRPFMNIGIGIEYC